jgi:antitoxin CptB
MRAEPDYMAAMHSDPDLKRLRWRAHHRGTREADALIGGFFDAHHNSWDAEACALFAALLDEQDVDIMAWALGTASAPERFDGPMLTSMKRLDYIRISR